MLNFVQNHILIQFLNFNYDYEAKQVTFEMPFDWSEKQMSHVNVVHVETHFQKILTNF